jgi:lysozyme family protein
MNDFEKAIGFIIGWETEWGKQIIVNDPNDPGKLTAYGFASAAHPEIDFTKLTPDAAGLDLAKALYMQKYWEHYGCDQMRWPINFVHMDCCVNIGNEWAGTWHGHANQILQRACSVTDDGIIGPTTTNAIRETDTITLAIKMIIERQRYYRAKIKEKPEKIRYMNGWFNRVEDLMLKALTS